MMSVRSNSARKFMAHYGVNIASAFWIAGNALLASSVGFGGTWNEAVAGIINLTSTGVSLSVGSKSFPAAVALAITGMGFQQGPHLIDGYFLPWFGFGVLSAGALPAIIEPRTQRPSAKLLADWKSLQQTVFVRIKKSLISPFAYPRVSYAITNTSCLLAVLANDVMHGRWYLTPIYALWLTGNLCASLSQEYKYNTVSPTALKRLRSLSRYMRERQCPLPKLRS